MYSTLQKWGEMQVIYLPKSISDTMAFSDYELLEISAENNSVIIKKAVRKSREYQKYPMEADSSSNIYWAKYMCENHYDGIIHIKSAFCTPEIGIIPILNKVCKDYDVPIIYFSFDSNTSEIGIKTRLEAFKDMLEMRKI